MDKDIRAAMLGDREAAKRLTEAGVLLLCPFCGKNEIKTERVNGIPSWGASWHCSCRNPHCFADGGFFKATEYEARLAWNTRAPIMSAEEMEMLEGME